MRIRETTLDRAGMSPSDYRRAKRGFIANDVFFIGFSTITSGNFLAALLFHLGASSGINAFIISLNVLGGTFQILAPWVTRRLARKKTFIVTCLTAANLSRALIFLTPIFGGSSAILYINGSLLFFSGVMWNLSNPSSQIWVMSCVSSDPTKVDRYFGVRGSAVFASQAAFFFIGAFLSDRMTGDNERNMLLTLGGIAVLLCLLQTVQLCRIKEPFLPSSTVEKKRSGSLREILTYRSFRPYFFHVLFHTIASNLTAPIFADFFMRRNGLSLSYLTLMDIVTVFACMICAPISGRVANRVGRRRMMMFATAFMAISSLPNAIVSPTNAAVIRFVCVLLYVIGYGAYSVSITPFLFESTPTDGREAYLAYSATFFGLLAFFVSMLSTAIVSLFAGRSLPFFGQQFTEMHAIFLLSAIFSVLAFLSIAVGYKVPRQAPDSEEAAQVQSPDPAL